MRKTLINSFAAWSPLAIAITGIFAVTYVTIQQCLRRAADDLPLQYATEVKHRILQGSDITDLLRRWPDSDPSYGLAPFVIVYNDSERAVAGNCMLNGVVPTPPHGVLQASARRGEYHVTWQPQADTRIAAVVLFSSSNGRQINYIIGGQSLRLVEERERFVSGLIFAGALFTLIATFVWTLIIQYLKIRKQAFNSA